MAQLLGKINARNRQDWHYHSKYRENRRTWVMIIVSFEL